MGTKTKVILGVIAVLVVLGIIGSIAGSGDDDKDTSTVASATKAPAATSEPEPADTAEPVLPSNQRQIGNLLLTLNGAAPYIDNLFPAEAGTHYIAVDVTARNTGTAGYALNVSNFRMKDTDSFTADSALTEGPEPKLGHHEMVPGQEVRGFIVFKVGDGRNPVELQYQSFTGTPGTIPIP